MYISAATLTAPSGMSIYNTISERGIPILSIDYTPPHPWGTETTHSQPILELANPVQSFQFPLNVSTTPQKSLDPAVVSSYPGISAQTYASVSYSPVSTDGSYLLYSHEDMIEQESMGVLVPLTPEITLIDNKRQSISEPSLDQRALDQIKAQIMHSLPLPQRRFLMNLPLQEILNQLGIDNLPDPTALRATVREVTQTITNQCIRADRIGDAMHAIAEKIAELEVSMEDNSINGQDGYYWLGYNADGTLTVTYGRYPEDSLWIPSIVFKYRGGEFYRVKYRKEWVDMHDRAFDWSKIDEELVLADKDDDFDANTANFDKAMVHADQGDFVKALKNCQTQFDKLRFLSQFDPVMRKLIISHIAISSDNISTFLDILGINQEAFIINLMKNLDDKMIERWQLKRHLQNERIEDDSEELFRARQSLVIKLAKIYVESLIEGWVSFMVRVR